MQTDEKVKLAFEYMMAKKKLQFTKKHGKKEMMTLIPDHHKLTWTIASIHADGSVDIASNKKDLIVSVALDWLALKLEY